MNLEQTIWDALDNKLYRSEEGHIPYLSEFSQKDQKAIIGAFIREDNYTHFLDLFTDANANNVVGNFVAGYFDNPDDESQFTFLPFLEKRIIETSSDWIDGYIHEVAEKWWATDRNVDDGHSDDWVA